MFLSTQIFNEKFDFYKNYGKPLHGSRAHSSPAQTAASPLSHFQPNRSQPPQIFTVTLAPLYLKTL